MKTKDDVIQRLEEVKKEANDNNSPLTAYGVNIAMRIILEECDNEYETERF